jgi:hypothetical protein
MFPRRIEPGLLAACTFAHGDARDVTGNGINFSLVNATASGGFLNSDGTGDYAEGAQILEMATNGNTMTIALWVRQNAVGAFRGLVNRFDRTGDSTTEDGWFLRFDTSNRLNLGVANNSAYTQWATTPTYSTTGVDQFFAMTWTAGAAPVFYAQGVAVASTRTAGAADTALPGGISYPIRLAGDRFSGATIQSLNGSLGDVRIYNRILSADRILEIYNNTRRLYT